MNYGLAEHTDCLCLHVACEGLVGPKYNVYRNIYNLCVLMNIKVTDMQVNGLWTFYLTADGGRFIYVHVFICISV